jgi:hypothetical protein
LNGITSITPVTRLTGKAITMQLADQYGRQVVKPVCADALRFAAIAGTTTLNERAIEQIKALGYTHPCAVGPPERL